MPLGEVLPSRHPSALSSDSLPCPASLVPDTGFGSKHESETTNNITRVVIENLNLEPKQCDNMDEASHLQC